MYLPKHFACPNADAATWLIKHYPLAQIVRLESDNQWACDPVPLLASDGLQAGACLLGHVARANALWQQEGAVLCIFCGPQAYISPNAYPGKQEHHRVVPTYNYATVQVKGRLRAIDDDAGKRAIITALTDHAEQSQPAPWAVDDAPDDFVQANLRAIVGIEIEIESFQAKFKLSQNRNPTDYAGVCDYLSQQATDQTSNQTSDNSADSNAAAMLKLMQTRSSNP